ncbi:MAG: VOC family protein [Balneolaceae bacterium]|nr:VOC family protein [Balneolaceae bacterium]
MDNRDSYSIPPETRIGHVHLKVSDLEKSLAFYCGLLGFEVVTTYGEEAVFISAGGYHHHIGLNTWHSKGGAPAPKGSTGLFHTAILYPGRKELARAVRRIIDRNYPLTGASDHGVSEAVYLDDPDGNGVELYRDRPEAEWPRKENGNVHIFTRSLDLYELLSHAGEE